MPSPTHEQVTKFVRESNAIEGIFRDPTEAEIQATLTFLELPFLTVGDLLKLQKVYAPEAPLRTSSDMNVRVGNHVAPRGGPIIEAKLKDLVERAHYPNNTINGPWKVHCDFEDLHPFLDGNGRAGRALWLWQMIMRHGYEAFRYPFLQFFYYQTLEHQR